METDTIIISKEALEDPKTLKIFLFIKKQFPETVGIREALRATKFRSSNTVSRHLTRLEESGLVVKLPSNRYKLSELGESTQSFNASTTVKVRLLKGNLITNNVFKTSFLFVMTLLTLVLIFFDSVAAAINGILGLAAHGFISFFQHRKEREKLDKFTKLSDES